MNTLSGENESLPARLPPPAPVPLESPLPGLLLRTFAVLPVRPRAAQPLHDGAEADGVASRGVRCSEQRRSGSEPRDVTSAPGCARSPAAVPPRRLLLQSFPVRGVGRLIPVPLSRARVRPSMLIWPVNSTFSWLPVLSQ